MKIKVEGQSEPLKAFDDLPLLQEQMPPQPESPADCLARTIEILSREPVPRQKITYTAIIHYLLGPTYCVDW